jgi:hypothetical protein
MKKHLPAFLFAFFLSISLSFAQKTPTIAEKTADFQKMPGFFPLYWDENAGKVWLEIDKLNTEFLYVNSLATGVGSNDIGLDRGQLGQERIVYFQKIGPKVLLVQPNQQYRAVSDNAAEKRSVQEAFAQSVLFGFKVEAGDNSRVLIDATDFLFRDAHGLADRIRQMKQGTYKPDPSRSAVYVPRTKSFPQNTEMEATLTFTFAGGNDAGNYVRSVVPSPEAITVRQHHSFVQLPDNTYQAREFDTRSSYIPITFMDYATPVQESITKRLIMRHRLKKKNPGAAVSEAVKPIVYYVDNGAPEPIRSALIEGASWWNQAFEAAGYKDAFQVKVLPDDADPMDVRYNLIQWVHRSTRGWSYGASVIDPRTGEIIKGHVSLGSLRIRQDYMIAEGLLAPYETGKPVDDRMMQMSLARIRQLSAHEVGHTLGLMHNYAASTNDRASVMDYPHPKARLDANGQIDLSQAYATGIGEWDKVAITFGYQDFAPGTDEKKSLNDILQKAIGRGLLFITDRDARDPSGAHPQAHLWDEGTDPVEELRHVLAVRQKALEKFSANNIREGSPMALLEDVLVPIYNYHRYQTEAVSKLIGGLNYTYAVKGDGQLVTEILPAAAQQKALDALLQTLSPEVLTLPESIIRLIPPRPAGYEPTRELFNKRTSLTFDPLSAAESLADYTAFFLLRPERAARLIEQKARGGGLGLEEVINAAITQTWRAQRQNGLAGEVQMIVEQALLTHLVELANNEEASLAAKAVANQGLETLRQFIYNARLPKKSGAKTGSPDSRYMAHLDYALERMKEPEKHKIYMLKELPPGAPIGSGDPLECGWVD